jgi:hypothetical protein
MIEVNYITIASDTKKIKDKKKIQFFLESS